MKIRLAFLPVLLVTVAALAADPAPVWTIDPAHSAAHFAVRHLAISTVRGQFDRVSGTVAYDPADPARTSIDAVIDASSIDTRVERRDRDLRKPSYFDVDRFPTITFKSTAVEPAGGGNFKVRGDLTMRGVTREVILAVENVSGPVKDQAGTERLGASATTKLNRRDFGINGGGAAVGNEVTITIDLELIR